MVWVLNPRFPSFLGGYLVFTHLFRASKSSICFQGPKGENLWCLRLVKIQKAGHFGWMLWEFHISFADAKIDMHTVSDVCVKLM